MIPPTLGLDINTKHTVHVSRTAYCYVRMPSCDTGELCVVFVCGSRSSCNLFLFYTLCTEFTMFRFASHIFSVVPCTVHSDLAYAAYSYSSGSFLTVLVLSFFCIFSFYVFFLFVILLLCQFSVVSTLSTRIVVHVRCLCGIHVVFVFWLVSLYFWEKRSCF